MRDGISCCLKEFLYKWKNNGNKLFLPLNSKYEMEMDRLIYDSTIQKVLVQL